MSKITINKVLSHPDKEEIISKLLLGISVKDIHDNLAARYSSIAEDKFVLSEKTLKTFKDNYLDLYKVIKTDIEKTKTAAITNTTEDVQLAVKNNPSYKEAMMKLANNELDLKTMLGNSILALDTRLAQISDSIQFDPDNINTRVERLWLEMMGSAKGMIETYHKYILQSPDQVIQHNITVQHLDQHISVFHTAIKKALSHFDVDVSLKFIEYFEEELSKIEELSEQKITPIEERFAEAKVISEKIDKQLNEPNR